MCRYLSLAKDMIDVYLLFFFIGKTGKEKRRDRYITWIDQATFPQMRARFKFWLRFCDWTFEVLRVIGIGALALSIGLYLNGNLLSFLPYLLLGLTPSCVTWVVANILKDSAVVGPVWFLRYDKMSEYADWLDIQLEKEKK